ncbi:universal stress protein [Winogradskyella aurantia]|jgi:nucleotide-binding universal stress UspA family protein|uniref:Universal stress protein UspA n=1 Tax=Winogradskyella aurantia TaxID=1915063 RepID=A0A265V0N3_9FLAO|nr:universal stress protein [Winogradskyella aurantia]OZV71109.1 universal stress protein UspA [Winogradskyella aurantia]
MYRILVPTDFSEQAENALKVAAMLAKKFEAEIYLLHMLEIPMQQIDPINAHSDVPEALFFMQLAHRKFEDLMDQDFLEGIQVHETVKADISFNEIKEACNEFEIDLIVMGSHGASGIMEVFVGSNAEKVVRTSDVPVLVIKNEHHSFNIKNFVFASDFKNDNRKTYEQAVKFAKAFDAKIHLLMVNTANKFITTYEANARINDFISGQSFDNYTITVHNDITIEQGILNFSKDIDADLIGISTHGRQGIAHFLNGSISEDLVNHAKRPVITFKI